MAVWGNVQSNGARSDAANAVRAALAMREELVRLNVQWRERGMPELRIGIAINHGDVVVGNVGSPRRMEFTVIGDAVNVSWKMQELTKQAGSDLVVSKSVASLVVEHFEVERIGEFGVPGFIDPFELCAIHRPIKLEQDIGEIEVPAAIA
jgi:adenylate cyclase